MEAFIIHNMAPIMFGSLVVVLLLGYPAAFSLGAVGLIFALIGIELGLFVPDFLQALPERVYGVMSNDTLLAIPFFTFMGLVLERSGMAEDLLDTIGQLFSIGAFCFPPIAPAYLPATLLSALESGSSSEWQ
jgi:TRAP-type mannitol/chloroaromatic compound transport system permease large subunit